MTRAGFSFIEMLVVLVLLAILLGMAVPPVARWRDDIAVRAARDEIAAALAWTRMVAVSSAGATLVIQPDSGSFRVVTADGHAGPAVDLASRYDIVLAPAGSAIEVRYDALGIGRLANGTVRIRRGSARAGLVISAYGRVRRW